jgi:hypothetical protein
MKERWCRKKRKKEASRKEVTKWKNCCKGVGKWIIIDLDQWLDRGPVEIKKRRKWKT